MPSRRKPGRKPKMHGDSPLLDGVTDGTYGVDEMYGVDGNGGMYGVDGNGGMSTGDKMQDRKVKNRNAADESRRRLRERAVHLECYTTRLETENSMLQQMISEMEQQMDLKHTTTATEL